MGVEVIPEGIGEEGGGGYDTAAADGVRHFEAAGVEVNAAEGVRAAGAVFDVAFDGAADD